MDEKIVSMLPGQVYGGELLNNLSDKDLYDLYRFLCDRKRRDAAHYVKLYASEIALINLDNPQNFDSQVQP